MRPGSHARMLRAVVIVGLLGLPSVIGESASTAYPGPPTCVEVASRNSSGGSSIGGAFRTMLSRNGRFVVFGSGGNDFGLTDSNGTTADVFVRDLQTEALEIVSKRSDGQQSSGGSLPQSISGDGRFVLFYNSQGDLIDGDSDLGGGVYLRDRQLGTTVLVSIGADGAAATTRDRYSASISDDGRFAAFVGDQPFLPGAPPNVPHPYRRDLVAGTTQEVPSNFPERDGTVTFGETFQMSSDGDKFVFQISDGHGGQILMSAFGTSSAVKIFGPNYWPPIMSTTGRYVVIASGSKDFYLYDSVVGSLQHLTSLEDEASSDNVTVHSVSIDGRYILYDRGTSVKFLDRANGELLGTAIYSAFPMSMSDDGRYFAAIGYYNDGQAIVAATHRPALSGEVLWLPRGGRSSVVVSGIGLDTSSTFSVSPAGVNVIGVAPGPSPKTLLVTFSVPRNTPPADYVLQATTIDGCTASGSPKVFITEGGEFLPYAPQRLVDTRTSSPLGAGETRFVPAPADSSGLILNVTVTQPTGVGYVTVFPQHATRPDTSNVNYTPNLTVANVLMLGTELGDTGFNIYNSGGTTQVVVDILGQFGGYPHRRTVASPSSRYASVSRACSRHSTTRVGQGPSRSLRPTATAKGSRHRRDDSQSHCGRTRSGRLLRCVA